MIELPHIKARVERIHELMKGLAKEVHVWKGAESPLTQLERRQHLDDLQDALAAFDDARVVLAGVVKRLEAGRR